MILPVVRRGKTAGILKREKVRKRPGREIKVLFHAAD
jgi:hypothetical protein